MIEEFNNKIQSKLVSYIKYLTERVEASVNDGSTIKLVKHQSIDQGNLDINYLVSHGLTGSFILKIYYTVTDGKGNKNEYTEDLVVPKMINSVFIIEGAMRIPTNKLDNDDAVTVYASNIRINDLLNIKYEYDEHEPGSYKLTAYIDDDDEPIVMDLTDENISKFPQYFKLTQSEIDKIKVKLDTDDVAELLTRDVILKLVNRGMDKKFDNMIDKKIYSPESNLLKYLGSREIKRKILVDMKAKFYQYKRIYLRGIQTALDRYFKVASDSSLSIPSTINPLVFDSLKYKVVVGEYVAFNNTMTDLIDVVNTPINSHTNIINELNVCTVIKDDVMYIKCYKYPTQEPVTLLYTTYCTKRVISNQSWDYENKKFLGNEVSYKLRLKDYKGSINDNYDYIDAKADDKLSITTRRIPMGNMSDSVRMNMSTGMLRQAVELSNAEQALVSAGHDDSDYELSTLITRYDGESSVVEAIKDGKIFLRNRENGSLQFYEIPQPTIGLAETIISFEPSVKVGDIVEKDDILVVPTSLNKRSFDNGVNANTIYMNYLGFGHEDGVVISETMSKKLRHYRVINVHKEIYPDDIIKYIRPVGSKVSSRDVLINDQTRLRVTSAINDLYTSNNGLLAGMGISFNQSNLIVPNNIEEAYIADVKMDFSKGGLTSEVTKKTIEDYSKLPKDEGYKNIPEKFRSLIANEVQIKERVAGYISFKLLVFDNGKVGDKVTNRYGSKGMISLVLPDECMPRIIKPDGTEIPAEILLNPAAINSRKNISQLYECALSKCIEAIYLKCTEYITNDKIDKAKKFLNKYYGNKFDLIKDEEFRKQHETLGLNFYRMDVGFFSKISYDTLKQWMEELNVKDTDQIFCPDVVICETKDGIRGFAMDKYQQQPDHTNIKKYDIGMCDAPAVTGKEYMLKLWHNAAHSGKVTPKVFESQEPLMGKGTYREVGQSLGEMELWILLETGSEKLLTTQSTDINSKQYTFLNELLLAGYTITENDLPMLSNVRTKQKKLEALK